MRVFEKKSQIIIEEDSDDTPEELLDKNIEIYDDGEGIRFTKGIDAGVLRKYTENILKQRGDIYKK